MNDSMAAIELREAVEANDLAKAAEMLRRDVSLINSIDSGNSTLLHTAAYIGNDQMMSMLLSNGADPMARDILKATPMHNLAHSGGPDGVRMLLTAGADVNARDRFERTPLHEAVQSVNNHVAEILIANGADLERRNYRGKSPLMMCLFGNTSQEIIATMLLESGASLDLNSAIRLGRVDLVRGLLHSDPDAISTSPFPSDLLHDAILIQSFDIVKLLLSFHAKVDSIGSYGCTALSYAARSNASTDVVNILIEHAADLQAKDYTYHGMTPFEVAMHLKNDRLAVLLVNNESNPS